jgi:hypothetical protein
MVVILLARLLSGGLFFARGREAMLEIRCRRGRRQRSSAELVLMNRQAA